MKTFQCSKMKTILSAMLILLCFKANCQVPFKRFSISLGSGYSTSIEIYEDANDAINILGMFIGAHYSKTRASRPLYAELHYSPVSWLEIGLIGVQQKFETEYFNHSNGIKTGLYKLKLLTVQHQHIHQHGMHHIHP